MQEGLYHPPHVVAALDQLDRLSDANKRAAIRVGRLDDGSKLNGDVLVRVLRRSRADGDRLTEQVAWERLYEDLTNWAWRAYSTLSEPDREDLVGGLREVIVAAICKSNRIDFWEITFARNRERAAADQYQAFLAARYGSHHEEFETSAHGHSDEGFEALETVEGMLIQSWASGVLTQEEMRFFQPLFLSDIPLSSPDASIDLVRMLDRPEGTLREIKTKIKKKLKRALERTS